METLIKALDKTLDQFDVLTKRLQERNEEIKIMKKQYNDLFKDYERFRQIYNRFTDRHNRFIQLLDFRIQQLLIDNERLKREADE